MGCANPKTRIQKSGPLASRPLLKDAQQATPATVARQIVLSGHVQGVGFRPFIYQLATKHHLVGWVRNRVGLVEVHAQGQSRHLENFVAELLEKKPPLAKPKIEENREIPVDEYKTFSIVQSLDQGEAHISVPTDLFLCENCLAELNDPSDRRYRYPFINCTQCGPRYTLIRRLPYDRPNTTMATFELCPLCRAEYEDPANRRFHAEPVACPSCGPSLSFHSNNELITQIEINNNETSLKSAIDILRQGKVLAVKGIGGYHLMCDAANTEAVSRLRDNKARPDKPLAVMFPAPTDNPFKYIESSVSPSDQEKDLLFQASRPIVLLAKNTAASNGAELSEQIAPGLNEIGIMLPYSPLHHLLLDEFGGPLVATSANISGEPVLIQNQQVEKRLGHVADAFLHHNRPIERPADDPVYRTIDTKPRPIRIGRGNAPLELTLPFDLRQPVLAVGAHMKNVITLAWGNRAVLSPHIGEMDSARSLDVFKHAVDDLQKLYGVSAELIICDAHPGYTTTRWASSQNRHLQRVYHHHAHASAAYYECNTDNSVIVFSWDGVGYGEDGNLWGGETFVGKPAAWRRVATMRPFNLPGGDQAGRQPWRSAAALCWEIGQAYNEIPQKDVLLKQAWQQKINAPRCTSVGRLFDAAAALTGLRTMASFEGQGPMELEARCNNSGRNPGEMCGDFITLGLEHTNHLLITDWEPLVKAMLDTSLSINTRASVFHASLAHAILQQAKTIRSEHGINSVTFSGGVFQNRVLTEQAKTLLSDNGFNVYIPELIPVNDASISFGQVINYGFSQQAQVAR